MSRIDNWLANIAITDLHTEEAKLRAELAKAQDDLEAVIQLIRLKERAVGADGKPSASIPSLRSAIKTIFSERPGPRDTDAVMAELAGRSWLGERSRILVNNELGKLYQEGFLARPERGVYDLADAAAAEPDAQEPSSANGATSMLANLPQGPKAAL